MDPQGNMTSGLGVEKNAQENTIYEVLLGECELKEAVISTEFSQLDLIPANVNLSGAEIELLSEPEKEFLLRRKIEGVRQEYDYIFIDCPPSLSLLTLNALTTANAVLVPLQCEYYALEGLSQLMMTINLVKERLNPELTMDGVVFTMYDSRTNLSAQVVDNVRNNLHQKIYQTTIPRNVRLAESPSHGLPIIVYDNKSVGAESYRRLAKEVAGEMLEKNEKSMRKNPIKRLFYGAGKEEK